MGKPDDVLDFWFGEDRGMGHFPQEMVGKWFTKDSAFDEEIRQQFDSSLWAATRGELDSWLETDEGTLAFVVLLDQFSRNLYRELPEEYSQDELCLTVTLEALERGVHKRLPYVWRMFLYLPLEHSEDIALQDRSVCLFEELVNEVPPRLAEFASGALDYAKQHRKMIARWGRFPYRNGQLGRTTTPEEAEFLKTPNSRF